MLLSPRHPPALVAEALMLVTDAVDEKSALARLIDASGGRRSALERAYGSAATLVAELPGDQGAEQVRDLFTKAIREVSARRPG